MNGFFENSVFFGVWISLLFYGVGCLLKKKLKMAIFNPLLIAILLTILFLLCFHIDCAVYQEGARYLSFLLTPATVCLAVPLYEQMELLKRNWRAVLAGIAVGVVTSLASVLLLAFVFRFDHTSYVTFLPKSVTTGDGIPFFCVVIDFRINRAAKLICYHLGFHFLQRDRSNAFSLTK